MHHITSVTTVDWAPGGDAHAGRTETSILLALAAMGAICDVTGLTGFNRALTSLGLRVMSDWGNPGLRALLAAWLFVTDGRMPAPRRARA